MAARRRPGHREAHPLTDDEREGIATAVASAFRKLRNLYRSVGPIFDQYGFQPPSAGVIARDLSEKIEGSIVQHCGTFKKGVKHADLERYGHPWEVKICKGSGLTINQSKVVGGESYIVINYDDEQNVRNVWVLWQAEDRFFSARKGNSNARTINAEAAAGSIEIIDDRRAKLRLRAEAARAASRGKRAALRE